MLNATDDLYFEFDLKIIQDVFTNFGGKNNTLQFTLDIFNFANLLNSEWGLYKQVNNSALLVPQNVAALVPGGAVVPTFKLATFGNYPLGGGADGYPGTYRNNNSYASTYYMQFGLRYSF